MANKDVLKIVFDADTKQFERDLLSSMDNVSDELSEKLGSAFEKAGRNPKLKKQLTGVYQGLFDDLTAASGDLDAISDAIDRFVGKIEYVNAVERKSKIKGIFDNLSIENVNKILKGYDVIIEKEEKLAKLSSNAYRDDVREKTTVKSLKSLESAYQTTEEAKTKYEQKVTEYVKNSGVETSAISKEIKEYSSLIALFEKINNTKVDYGTEEAVKKSQALLFVMQKIEELDGGNKLFSNFRKNELQDIEHITSSISELTINGVEGSITSFIKKMVKPLKTEIEQVYQDVIGDLLKMSKHQAISDVKTQAKVDKAIGDRKGSGRGTGSGSGNMDELEQKYDEHNNIFAKYFDTAKKSAEELEDVFAEVEDKLDRLYQLSEEGELKGKKLKEYITLYKQLEDLSGKIEGFEIHSDYTDQYDVLVSSNDELAKYANQLDEIREKGYIKEESTGGKGTGTGTGDVDDSKVEELRQEIKEAKEDISSLKGRVETLEDTTAFDNLSSQVAGFDEKIKNVDGAVENLVSSFKLLSELSLTDLQKVVIPFFNGINQVYKENNGNKISGYWDGLKENVEGSNVELRELLKLVGLYNSEQKGLQLVSSGMVKSGGLVGDTHTLLATKNKNNRFQEAQLLKEKLDEAYAAGVNVSRILDIIGTKESDVFLEVQETAKGNILGDTYNDNPFVNPEMYKATDEQIKKLMSDLITLNKLGIGVDTNLTNIFYDKEKGFSFIDLDLQPVDFKNYSEMFSEFINTTIGEAEVYYEDIGDKDNLNIVQKLRERFSNLAEQVQQAYAEAQDSHSPSKEFEKLENDAVEGIVTGANNNEERLKNVGRQMADNVKDGFKEGMAEISMATTVDSSDSTEENSRNNLSLEEKLAYLKEIQKYSKFMEDAEHRKMSMEDKGYDAGGNNPKSEADSLKKIKMYEDLCEGIEKADAALDEFQQEYESVILTMKDGQTITINDFFDLDEIKLLKSQIKDIQFVPFEEIDLGWDKLDEEIVDVKKVSDSIIEEQNKVQKELQETRIETEKVANVTKNNEQSLTSTSTSADIDTVEISQESEQLEALRKKIAEVTDAVDTKTRAFQEEEQVVVGTVQREISNLELLDGQLLEIISTIEKLKTTPINIDLKLGDGDNIDNNLTTLLSDLDDKVKNLDVESLSKFATALKDLKVTGKSAENLELVAVALGEFRTSLAGISAEENNFLLSISTIVSKTDELKDLVKVLESSTKKIKETGKAVDNMTFTPDKDEENFKKDKSSKNGDTKKTDAISETINKMKELKHVGSGELFEEVFAKASKKVEEFNADLASGDKTLEEYNLVVKRLFDNIKNGYTNSKAMTFDFIEPKDLKSAEVAMRDYALSVSGGNAELKRTIDGSGNVVYTWTDENKMVHTLTQSYDQMTGALGRVHKQQKQAEKHNKTFIESLKQGWLNVRQYVMSFVGFYEIVNAIKTGLRHIKELDTALTEMRKVSDETVKSLRNFQDVSFDIASSIGTTAKEIQNSAADFMRLGYSLKEASELAQDANIYANVGDMEIDEATEHMVSSIKAWGSEFNSEVEASGSIVDRYNEIGNNFAITSADIGSAMERSAAALKAGGNTLNEALGLITAGNLIQQDADTTANALKVMSLRIRGSKTDLEEMGEETDGLASSTSKLREEIKALSGVDIMKDENTYKSTAEIIQEIGAVYDKLSDVSKASLLEKLAGKTRASTVSGLLENYKTIGEVIESAENADGSAIEENLRYMESIEGKISKFTNEVQEFWHNLIDSNTVKGFVDAGTWIIDKLAKIADLLGDIGTLGAAAGVAFGIHKIKNGGGGRVKKFALIA